MNSPYSALVSQVTGWKFAGRAALPGWIDCARLGWLARIDLASLAERTLSYRAAGLTWLFAVRMWLSPRLTGRACTHPHESVVIRLLRGDGAGLRWTLLSSQRRQELCYELVGPAPTSRAIAGAVVPDCFDLAPTAVTGLPVISSEAIAFHCIQAPPRCVDASRWV